MSDAVISSDNASSDSIETHSHHPAGAVSTLSRSTEESLDATSFWRAGFPVGGEKGSNCISCKKYGNKSLADCREQDSYSAVDYLVCVVQAALRKV